SGILAPADRLQNHCCLRRTVRRSMGWPAVARFRAAVRAADGYGPRAPPVPAALRPDAATGGRRSAAPGVPSRHCRWVLDGGADTTADGVRRRCPAPDQAAAAAAARERR